MMIFLTSFFESVWVLNILLFGYISTVCGAKKNTKSDMTDSQETTQKKNPGPIEKKSAGATELAEKMKAPEEGGRVVSIGVGGANPTSGAPKKEEEGDINLGPENPDIKYILETDNDITDQYFVHIDTLLEKCGTYMWGIKKRIAADEASWKELARRIGKMAAEGFDVKTGTEEARMRRIKSNFGNDLEKLIEKKKPVKGKKKHEGE